MLLSLFPKLDPADLKNALASNGTLYASFQFLTTQRHNNSGSNIGIHHPAFQPLLDSLRNRYPQLLEEVQAARKSLEQRHQAKAKERAEEENLLEAQRNRAMGEWYVLL